LAFNPEMMKQLLLLLMLLPLSNHAQGPIKILFVGDVMGHGPQLESAKQSNGGYDFTPWFAEVAPAIQSADMAIANLEVTLPGKPPYTGYPQFRSPDNLAESLREAGFDMLVTSNNHSCDGGLNGITHTLDALDFLGLQHTGTFRDKAERSALYPLIAYQNGYKIAFVNATYGTNGIPTPAPSIVNLIDTVEIARDLSRAREHKPDLIIAVMHWGLEYQLTENAEQRAIAKMLLRHGADVVIGAHPHVVQPVKYETVTRLDGTIHTGLVAYSLGNFISNQVQPNTDGGLMITLTFDKNAEGHLVLKNYNAQPVCRLIAKTPGKKNVYRAVLCGPEMSDAPGATIAQMTHMRAWGKKLRERLGL
jgi:poly-gamma-glutamate capsule biosynthesis protein CapA/YwtB (metallophosphatase superfamily)